MTTSDEQVVRTLERRFELVWHAPPERFSGELARYLAYIAEQPTLRAIVTGVLEREAAGIAARQQMLQAAAREYAASAALVARALADALRTWVLEGTLPSWLSARLAAYDEDQAQAALEAGGTPWLAVRAALGQADLHDSEVDRLLDTAGDAEARWLALRSAEERLSAFELTGILARLWGHVRHHAVAPALPEWSGALTHSAELALRQSNRTLLLRQLMAHDDSGSAALRASLYHDLRRLTAQISDSLDTSPPALPALERLRRWCELYERAAMLRRIRPGKKASETTRRRKRETVVADVMRSLYSQGFTPLTLAMLEGEGQTAPLSAQELINPLLVEVLVVSDREALLNGYVACVQALRGSDHVRRLGLREAFLVAFVVEPVARFVEPPPLDLPGGRLRSLFIDLTAPGGGRQPLTAETVAARLSEEDRLFDFLNSASEATLDTISGIGPAKIQQIIAGRPYGSAADLRRAGLSTSGTLYQAIRNEALRGMQTLLEDTQHPAATQPPATTQRKKPVTRARRPQ